MGLVKCCKGLGKCNVKGWDSVGKGWENVVKGSGKCWCCKGVGIVLVLKRGGYVLERGR